MPPLDNLDFDPLLPPPPAPSVAAPAAAAPAAAAPAQAPVVAVRDARGRLVDPTTGLLAPADMPDEHGRLGVLPVIDVGTPSPGAQPGEPGSQFRPARVGEAARSGQALPAAAVPQQRSGADVLAGRAEGGAIVPTAAAQPVPAAPAVGTAPPAPAAAGKGADFDPLADIGPAVPDAVKGQELRNQPWYQGIADNVRGALGSLTHGASFGLDEILDPLVPAIVKSLHQGIPFTQAYDQAVKEQRVPRTEFQQAHPVASSAIELAGNVPGMVAAEPLFVAGGAPTVTQAVVNAMRNIGASGALGGAAGFGMTDGTVAQRLEGAKQGAQLGAVVGAVAPALPALVRGARRAVTPSANIPGIVGRTVAETAGGVPALTAAPVPSVGLDLAQSTGRPEVASALDTLNAANVPAMQRARSEQNAAMVNAVTGRTPGEPRLSSPTSAVPEVAAARGSTRASSAISVSQQIIRSEEHRLWNTAALTEPNVSSITAKNSVQQAVRKMRVDEPGLALAIEESAALRRTIAELRLMPEKAAANQLNAISSRFRAIARNPLAEGDVRHVATRLANAVQEGMANAPEVVGVKPATAREITEAETHAATVPRTPGQPITAAEVQRRDGVGYNVAYRRAAAENAANGVQIPSAVGELGRVRRPESLLEFLTRSGGIQPNADLKAMGLDAYHHRAGGRLLNNKGRTPDYARELAVEAGYLPQGADINDLYDAMAHEARGNRVYRAEDLAEAEHWEQMDQAANDEADRREQAGDAVREAAAQHDIELTPSQQEHAAEMLAKDPELHPEEAVRQASRASEEEALQHNAQRLAFGGPGVAPEAIQEPLPDLKVLREGVKPNPQLVADLKRAREFTKREAEVLGHASFDGILRRNSRGNETSTPGTALSRFFDFANGVERPGAIRNVSRFLDDIRSSWLKLSAEERGRTFDPTTIAPVKRELEEGTRSYVMAKMLDAISSKEMDMSGNRMIQYRQAVDWLNTNRDMLQRTGLFSRSQMDLLDRFNQTAQLIQRGADLGKAAGSPTFTRAMHPVRFVDLFTGPFIGRMLDVTAAGTLGALTTHWLGEAAIGAMIGAEMLGKGSGGQRLMSALYQVPREKLLAKLDEAFRNPQIAHDLADKVAGAGKLRPSDQTKAWIRSLIAVQPAAIGGRVAGVPDEAQGAPPSHAEGGMVTETQAAPVQVKDPQQAAYDLQHIADDQSWLPKTAAYQWGWSPAKWVAPPRGAKPAAWGKMKYNADGSSEGVSDTGVPYKIDANGIVSTNLHSIPDPRGGPPTQLKNSLYNPYNDPYAFNTVTGEPLFGWSSPANQMAMQDYYAGKLQPVQLRVAQQQHAGDETGTPVQFAPSSLPYAGWAIPGNTGALNGQNLDDRLANGRAAAATTQLPAFFGGGPIAAVGGPKPANADDGYITAQRGEFVVKRDAVAKYGPQILNALNAGLLDPGVLASAMRSAAQ